MMIMQARNELTRFALKADSPAAHDRWLACLGRADKGERQTEGLIAAARVCEAFIRVGELPPEGA